MPDTKNGLPAYPDELSWGSLTECVLDEIASLRQSSEYARSTAYKEKIDSLTYCMRTLVKRLEGLGCVPNVDEPAFLLLARDPAAAELVRSWADTREHVVPPRPAKVAAARLRAEEMDAWRARNPVLAPAMAADTTGGQQGQACGLPTTREPHG